jgi:hypothetical protein
MRLFCVCVVLCIGSVLATGLSFVQGVRAVRAIEGKKSFWVGAGKIKCSELNSIKNFPRLMLKCIKD